MTGEFQAFIDARAHHDTRYVSRVADLCRQYKEFADERDAEKERTVDDVIGMTDEQVTNYVAMIEAKKEPQGPPEKQTITRAAVEEAMRNQILLIGEIGARLQARYPRLFEEYPDLVCFRRLRDIYAHPERHLFNEAKQKEEAKRELGYYRRLEAPGFDKFIPVLFDRMRNRREFAPMINEMIYGIQTYQLLNDLSEVQGDTIFLNDMRAKQLYYKNGYDNDYVPFAGLMELVHIDADFIRITDAAEATSVFAKQNNATPISRKQLDAMGIARNHMAHFNVKLAATEADEQKALKELQTEKLDAYVENLFTPLSTITDWDAYRAALVKKYEAQVFGTAPDNVDTRRVLDFAVTLATAQAHRDANNGPSMIRQYEEAFVLAAAKLFNYCQPAEAMHILEDIASQQAPLLQDRPKLKDPALGYLQVRLDMFVSALKSNLPPQKRGQAV